MNARSEILARIAQAKVAPAAPVARGYRGATGAEPGQSADVERFVDRLLDYKAVVHRCTAAQTGTTVAQALSESGARQVVVPTGFPSGLLPTSLAAVQDDPPLSHEALDALDGVVTTCRVAIAETGTIVLDGGAGQGRRALSLVPDRHVVLVRSEQVVAAVPDALAVLDPTRPQTWISGPSATSDIELQRVEGVHGPRRLHVVLVQG
ncbi:MAG: lactate utilization protein C [Geodermatophilaceae bacterium]|nr:lactate utilization protein C [Geodermatophilaceae bacterium]